MKELPVKVLAVVYQMNRGGLENRLMDILRNIDRSKVQIDIFTYRETKGLFDDEVIELGSKIYYNKPLTVRNMFGYVNYFADFLREHREYQIVHAHQDAWCSVFLKGAKKARIPVRIAHSRTAIENSHSIQDLAKNIIKLPTKRYATHMFAVSKKASIWLYGRKNFESGKTKVWPNAIEASKYKYSESVRSKVKNELGLTNEHVVMHVGNFTPAKNHSFIIEIFSELIKKDNNFKLVLVGGGNDTQIKELVCNLKLQDHVMFLGVRSDVERLLQAADVFLFPSLFEGLPGAVIEAEASGLPCVISDTISDEVVVTPNVKRISLSSDKSVWVKEVVNAINSERIDTKEYFQKNGYDVKYLVRDLEQFYINCI